MCHCAVQKIKNTLPSRSCIFVAFMSSDDDDEESNDVASLLSEALLMKEKD